MTETPDRIRRAPVGLGMPRAPEAPDHATRKLEQGRIPGIEALDALPGEECATRETRRFHARPSPPIVDGTGYPSVTRGGENPFLQPVNARHGKGAMIPASNRGFAGWGDVSGGPVVATALPDRPPHHAVAVRTGGAGHRPRGHTDLIPEHTRTDAPVTPPPPPERRGRPPGNGAAGHRTGRQPKPPDRGMSNRPFWGNLRCH